MTMTLSLYTHLLVAICASLWITSTGTSGFSVFPAASPIRIGSHLDSSSSSNNDDGGQSAYEQQMKGMMQNQQQAKTTPPQQEESESSSSLVSPQPNSPNEAQLMKVQERQFLDRPILQATPTPSSDLLVPNNNNQNSPKQQQTQTTRIAKKRSDYVDFEPDPQYFWKRDEHEYEISETRWVRNRKK